MNNEIWKPIEGYELLYEVSSLGSVKSLDKVASYRGHSYLNGRVLKQEVVERNHTNYRRVTLSKNSVTKRFQVHRLVAKAFIVNEHTKPQVNHIDNNGENNNYTNLEWCTAKENMRHSYNQGRMSHSLERATNRSIKVVMVRKRTKFEMMVGRIFKDNKLLSIISLGKHPIGLFKCIRCGSERHGSIESVFVQEDSKRCKSCALRLAHRKRKFNNGDFYE